MDKPLVSVFIKSYNRMYYLERCLFSVKKYLIDTNYSITVIDDGTPEVYLNALKTKYPEIQIQKTEFYNQKTSYCSQGLSPKEKHIPINSWVDATKNASEYFLWLEDDIWLTSPISLQPIIAHLKTHNTLFLKFFWLGNPDIIQAKEETPVASNILALTPKLPVWHPFLYKLIFYKFDRFKIRKTFKFLNIHTRKKDLSFYSLYSVAGNIFQKEYFTSLWENHTNNVDEKLQIYNALRFLKNKGLKNEKNLFFRSQTEWMRTGFCSSASQPKKNRGKMHSNWMFQLNYNLNELWLHGKFNSIENFPFDFSEKYFEQKLIESKTPYPIIDLWKKWRIHFIKEFEGIGCRKIVP